MPSWVLTAWGFVTGGVGSVIGWITDNISLLLAYWMGKRSAQNAIQQKNSEIKDAQLRDAARAPKTREKILERMKRYGL